MKKNVFLKCVWRYSPLFLLELVLSWLLARAVVEGNSLIGAAVDSLLAGEEVEYTSFLAYLLILTLIGFAAAFLKSLAASHFSIRGRPATRHWWRRSSIDWNIAILTRMALPPSSIK